MWIADILMLHSTTESQVRTLMYVFSDTHTHLQSHVKIPTKFQWFFDCIFSIHFILGQFLNEV